jgi:peptidoglycan/xylan/chitin deacetylase (PgdA/CDA1 family)
MTGNQKSFFTLMFHGVVERLPEYALYPATYDCQLRKNDFEKAIRYCSEHFKILRQNDLTSYYNGTAQEDGVLISFDDALLNVHTNAIPILEKYKVPATIFVTSDWTNNGVAPPVFALEYILYSNVPATIQITKENFSFTRQVNKIAVIPATLHQLWTALFEARVAPLLLKDTDILVNGHSLNDFSVPDKEDCWKPASWQMLAEAHGKGLIEIGAHGRTHAPWTWLPDSELEQELIENKSQIKKHLGIDVTACSYPHGLRDERTVRIVQKHFTYAFGNNPSKNPIGDGPMNVSRYNVPYQRPNDVSLIIKYNRLGNNLRRIGSLSGFY